MKLPDFTALGAPPSLSPSESVAKVPDPGAADTALEGFGAAAEKAGSGLQDMLNVADVNNAYANVYAPKAAELASNYYSLTGNAAVQARPQFIQSMQDLRQQTVGDLNGQAATNLEKMIQPHEQQEVYRAGLHAGQQAVVYANTAYSAMQDNSRAQYAGQVLDNPDAADDTLINMKSQAQFHWEKMGTSGDVINQATREIQEQADKDKQGQIQARMGGLPGAQQQALLKPFVEAQTSSDGGAPDLGASFVKPYSAARVAEIKSQIDAPSPYDALFQKYGDQYGIDPKELKLHAVVESGLNPKADNGQSVGLMQLQNDNVAKLGIKDAFDPAQSIEGAAKLMAQNKAAGANDPHSADIMYYGGSDRAQQGKNTQQYAANLSAVRGNGVPASGENTTDSEDEDVSQSPKIKVPPNTPAWLAGASPELISTMVQTANATAAHDARILGDKEDAAFQKTQQTFVGKWAQDKLTTQDILSSNLPPLGQGSQKFWLDQISKGPEKVDPNDPAVIKQHGILENMKVEDPKSFLSMDLSTITGKLPASDIQRLQGDQVKMKQGDQSIEGQNKQAGVVVASVNDMLPIEWKNPKTQDIENLASAFKGNLITAVNDAQAAGGKPLDRTGVRKIASDMLANVSVKGTLWDSTMPAYKVPAGTNALSVYRGTPDNIYIPESFRTGITRAWQSRFNRQPQETDVRAAYLKSLK